MATPAPIKSPNSARPGSLKDPVPSGPPVANDEAMALDAFLASQPKGGNDEAQALSQFQGNQNVINATNQGNSALSTAGDAVSRGLDYPGGLVRTGLAEAAGVATGQPNVVTPEDLKSAAVGKAPSSAEYLRKLGVPEQGSVTLPGVGKVTVRGAEGLALDIATDPLTLISKMLKEIPYLGKLIGAPGIAADAVGETIYKAGLSKVDAKLAEKGKNPISDVLLQEGKDNGFGIMGGNGVTGTTEKIAEKTKELSDTMGKIRQGLYDKAAEKGVTIDTGFPLKNAESVLAKMRSDPGLAPAAEELQALLERYKSQGKVDLSTLSEWKTNLYDSLPQSAFDGPGRLKAKAKQFKAALASDFRQAIAEAGNKAEPGLGDSINAVNERWGTLLSAQKPLDKQAASAAGKSFISGIDAAIIGSGHVGADLAKKAAELGNTTWAKTKFGAALMAGAKNGLVDAASRRAFIDYMNHKKNNPNEQYQIPSTGTSVPMSVDVGAGEVNNESPTE